MESNRSNSNASVISLLKKGDARAYKTIFDAYYQFLFAFSAELGGYFAAIQHGKFGKGEKLKITVLKNG